MHVIEDDLAFALLELMGFLNSPRQDEVLLRAAGVSLDRALFPVLARIDAQGAASVVDLAGEMDRDPSTLSRQVARLEELGLVTRRAGAQDRRVREAVVTAEGQRMVEQIRSARRRVFTSVLATWSADERAQAPRLIRKLVDGLKTQMANFNR
jgi:DNA-binding MarR family transcriptional regulator